MKKLFSFVFILALLLSIVSCSGNYAKVDLRKPIPIPENGIIEKQVLDEIKTENAIATFEGMSGNLKYEWIIFGSDISETRDINLSLSLEEKTNSIAVNFNETNDFGFSVLLSIYLNEKWTADSATAFVGDTPIYSVSITGSKTSILNISINKIAESCNILPDIAEQTDISSSQDTSLPEETTKIVVETNKTDDYLSNSQNETKQNPSNISSPEETSKNIAETNTNDNYLSNIKDETDRVYSDGNKTNQDKYKTDPVPEGKPMPVEPENQEINNQKTYTCTFSIECSTILNNLSDLDTEKLELLPSNGVILTPTEVTFYEGESVFDVLQRVCKEKEIHMESSWTPIYNSAYIEGIHNLYEFDCGELSGWMYRVNGWYPNYGCSRYQLVDGEIVEWRYTCDLGKDVGCDWMG